MTNDKGVFECEELEKEIEKRKKQYGWRYPFDEFWFSEGFQAGQNLLAQKVKDVLDDGCRIECGFAIDEFSSIGEGDVVLCGEYVIERKTRLRVLMLCARCLTIKQKLGIL